MSLLGLLGLVAVGVVAGVINTVAGGGSLLTLPALVFAGLPPTVANGTNRVGILVGSVTAVRGFALDPDAAPPPDRLDTAAAVAGALVGASLSVDLDEAVFRRLLGVVLLVALPMVMSDKALQPAQRERPVAPWLRALGFAVVGAYGGFVQAGVGVLLTAAFVGLAGRDLVGANAGKVMVVALYTVPAIGLFWWAGKVWWLPGLALAAGSAVGGWLGARWAITAGAEAVRPVLALAVVVSGVRLIWSG